jgi:hypothetical protein
MVKEEYLTVRWNNYLTLGLGLILLVYVFFGMNSSVLSDGAAFFGLVILGVLY